MPSSYLLANTIICSVCCNRVYMRFGPDTISLRNISTVPENTSALVESVWLECACNAAGGALPAGMVLLCLLERDGTISPPINPHLLELLRSLAALATTQQQMVRFAVRERRF
jgi:hypothetical protein